VGLVGAACVLALATHGSIAASAWLPYAVAAALAAMVAAAACGVRPSRPACIAVAALGGLAVWDVVSLTWSAAPSLARDEGLLAGFYALGLAVPLLALRTAHDRLVAVGGVAAVVGVFTIVLGAKLLTAGHPEALYVSGRLAWPISYTNTDAAIELAGFWPAVLLAARSRAHLVTRALASGVAAGTLAATLAAQSKGAVLGFAVSALVGLALSPSRLRLALPTLAAIALTAAAFRPLTRPFDVPDASAVRGVGAAILAVAVAGAVAGLAIALVDRRLALSDARRRQIGRIAGAGLIAVVVCGVVGWVAAVGDPFSWLGRQWNAFKTPPRHETGSTHLLTLGSNRYDFWRVALHLFVHHPLGGVGARGFGAAYLIAGRSTETPARAHSLPLDVLAETGVVGFALLLAALGTLLVLVGRGARAGRGPSFACLAGAVCLLGQMCVDWTWTFPSAGLALAALLGIGASGSAGTLPVRSRSGLAAVAAAVALFAFLPPWLSAHLVQHGLAAGRGAGASDLRWAHRLDPVSSAPLVAQAITATSLDAELDALRAAVRREPRVLQDQYLLGVALENAGLTRQARAHLQLALSLHPGDPFVRRALAVLP
jgi:O-antigen ligase/polysaccharide polymerase Wzy-like membrane protein